MAFANKWATFLSYIGRRLFFFLIFLQVPLFRIPYRGEICTTPLELTCRHLISIDIWPPIIIKNLLYPGVLANGLIKDMTIPNFKNMLQIYLNIRSSKSNEKIDLNRVEVLVGSYLSVGGAVLGLLWPGLGRMSLAGTLLTLWGLKKDLFLKSQTRTYPREDVSIYPAILIAIILAFFSIKGDVRELIRCFRRRRKSKYY